jgi:hypothetical protein
MYRPPTISGIYWIDKNVFYDFDKKELVNKTIEDFKIEFENEITNKLEMDTNFNTYNVNKNTQELVNYINGLTSIMDKIYIISRILNEIKRKDVRKEIIDKIQLRIPRNYNKIWNEYIHSIIGKEEMKNKIVETFITKHLTKCIKKDDIEVLEFLVNIKKINKWSITSNEYDEILGKAPDIEIIEWIGRYTDGTQFITKKTIDILCDLEYSINNNKVIITHLELYYKRFGKNKFEKMYSKNALNNLIKNRNVGILMWWYDKECKLKYDQHVIIDLVKGINSRNKKVIGILRKMNILNENNIIKEIIVETSDPNILEELKESIVQSSFSREMEDFKNLYIQDENEYITQLKKTIMNIKKYYIENYLDIDKESVNKIEYLINNYETIFSLRFKSTRFRNLINEIDKIIEETNIKTKTGGYKEYILYINKLLKEPNEYYRILDWLNSKNLINGYYTDEIFEEAFKLNNIFILDWLYENGYQMNISKEILNYAIERDHIQILNRYIDINTQNNRNIVFTDDVIKYVRTERIMRLLVRNMRNFNIKFPKNILDNLSEQHDIECYKILKYLFNEIDYNLIKEAYSNVLIDKAIIKNNIHIIRWIKEIKDENKIKYSTTIFDNCLNEEVIKQFMENEINKTPLIKIKITEKLVEEACINDKVNILELYINYKPKTYDFEFKYNEKALQLAIENNSYNVVKWFIDEFGYKIKINKEWLKEHIDKMRFVDKMKYKYISKFYYVDEKIKILDKLLKMKLKNEN